MPTLKSAPCAMAIVNNGIICIARHAGAALIGLHDPAQESEGLVAQGPGGKLVGLAHFRPYARPLAASTGLFLDDLFVSPDARGSGAADALIEGVRKIAEARGCSLVRWITAEDNYRGRGLYDRVASRTAWVTYDIKLPS